MCHFGSLIPQLVLADILSVELLRDGFGKKCYFKVLLAELAPPADYVPAATSSSPEQNERLIGYALYYFTYSGCQGRVINLEDIFVKADYRSEICYNDHSVI